MFTGIIEALGTVSRVRHGESGSRLVVAGWLASSEVEMGDSVAINGVCLTVVQVDEGELGFDAVPETLARTNLGGLGEGSVVNLERPLAAAGRFDGHVVQGHVDGTATVRSVEPEGGGRRVWHDLDPRLLRYLVVKGSVCVDGVSLTVTAVDANGFEVALIPHTTATTTLGSVVAGSVVNVEVDVLAKYVERLLEDG